MVIEGDSFVGVGICGCQRGGCSCAHAVVYTLVALLHGDSLYRKYVSLAACPVLLPSGGVDTCARNRRHIGCVTKLNLSSLLAFSSHDDPAYLLSP